MQRIPGHRTGDGERPTAERAATMSWYDKMVAAGRSKSLTTANGSSSRGTGEPCLGDTGELSLRAYGGFAGEHQASAARSKGKGTSLRTSTVTYPHSWQSHLRPTKTSSFESHYWEKDNITFRFLPRDAMHKRGLRCHAVSVRLSRSWSWIKSKRINISSKFFHHWVATPF